MKEKIYFSERLGPLHLRVMRRWEPGEPGAWYIQNGEETMVIIRCADHGTFFELGPHIIGGTIRALCIAEEASGALYLELRPADSPMTSHRFAWELDTFNSFESRRQFEYARERLSYDYDHDSESRDRDIAIVIRHVATLREALQWCSAAEDFQEGGKAYEGWLRLCSGLL